MNTRKPTHTTMMMVTAWLAELLARASDAPPSSSSTYLPACTLAPLGSTLCEDTWACAAAAAGAPAPAGSGGDGVVCAAPAAAGADVSRWLGDSGRGWITVRV
uniref:Putative secreted protein n=1 Tax=Ixodes ricinus TaxID=34613 RepID=A0A6B0U7H8_IXORI